VLRISLEALPSPKCPLIILHHPPHFLLYTYLRDPLSLNSGRFPHFIHLSPIFQLGIGSAMSSVAPPYVRKGQSDDCSPTLLLCSNSNYFKSFSVFPWTVPEVEANKVYITGHTKLETPLGRSSSGVPCLD